VSRLLLFSLHSGGILIQFSTHVWFLSVEPAGKLALQMQVELLHYRGRVYTPKASLQRFVGTNDSKIGIVSVFKTDR
jgi:hypothetical protein